MTTNIPHHVAIIPDGNRRWARGKGLPTIAGHQAGFEALVRIGQRARDMGIKVLTVWAFSTENWDRSQEEKSYLMKIFETMIDDNLKTALKDEIRIIHLGRKDRISSQLRDKIINAEDKTKGFTKYYLCIALDYGGRNEIVRALNNMRSTIGNSQITEDNLDQYLDTHELPYPNPDLIIRTGGEMRLSGFMPWQSQYSELIFVKKYLPDFTVNDFNNCIKEYNSRQRRYGK